MDKDLIFTSVNSKMSFAINKWVIDFTPPIINVSKPLLARRDEDFGHIFKD